MSDRASLLRAVLFDFDGTLVNTTPLILRCFRATCEQVFGFACEDAAYIQTFGIPLQAAMAQMIERLTTEGRIAAFADPAAKARRNRHLYGRLGRLQRRDLDSPPALWMDA